MYEMVIMDPRLGSELGRSRWTREDGKRASIALFGPDQGRARIPSGNSTRCRRQYRPRFPVWTDYLRCVATLLMC